MVANEVIADIREYEANCNGTDEYYKHWLGRFVYTDGVKYVAEKAGAYWLIDAIASHQTARVARACDGFQCWSLTKNKSGSGAVLRCTDGNSSKPAVSQRIKYTDFPLPAGESFHFYLENGVLLLVTER